jgi:hypothetical protein
MTDNKRICFVISPIGSEGSEIRKWANQTFKHLIKPVAENLGFEALRADQESKAGIITTHIIQRLANSELVIADLSYRNPNVFYELAVRHVARKPLVQIIRDDEDIPFDVQGMRTVKYRLDDPDILESAKSQLGRQIDGAMTEEKLDTPISQAVDLQLALESGDPGQVQLAEISEAIQNLTAEVRAQRPTFFNYQQQWPSSPVMRTVIPNASGRTVINPQNEIRWLSEVQPSPGSTSEQTEESKDPDSDDS